MSEHHTGRSLEDQLVDALDDDDWIPDQQPTPNPTSAASRIADIVAVAVGYADGNTHDRVNKDPASREALQRLMASADPGPDDDYAELHWDIAAYLLREAETTAAVRGISNSSDTRPITTFRSPDGSVIELVVVDADGVQARALSLMLRTQRSQTIRLALRLVDGDSVMTRAEDVTAGLPTEFTIDTDIQTDKILSIDLLQADLPQYRSAPGGLRIDLPARHRDEYVLGAASVPPPEVDDFTGGQLVRQRFDDGSSEVTVLITDPALARDGDLIRLTSSDHTMSVLIILLPSADAGVTLAGRIQPDTDIVFGQLELSGPFSVAAITTDDLAAVTVGVQWSDLDSVNAWDHAARLHNNIELTKAVDSGINLA